MWSCCSAATPRRRVVPSGWWGLLAAAGLLLAAAPAAAQQVRSAVVPDTITVGDVVKAAVRVDLPAGYSAAFPDSLSLGTDLENAGPRRDTTETLPGGARRITSVYLLTGWRPGIQSLPAVPITITNGTNQQVMLATLQSLVIRSVLPVDTAGLKPKPVKAVVGPNWLLWPFIVALILLLLLLWLLYWLWKKYRQRTPVVVAAPAVGAREAALAEIDRARADLFETGDIKRFYVIVSEALRHYLAAIDSRWSADLTTSELAPRMYGVFDRVVATELERLLRSADMVKFAKVRPTRDEALAEGQRFRTWVENFAERPPAPPQEIAA